MFAKPFRVKTQNAIKGCDRKKLRSELATLYPSIPNDQLYELVPNKEDMTTAKVRCHNGETILVYCLQKNPIFFDVDKIVYPTVYLLWKYPDLIHGFRTWPQVFPRIKGGADLMMPGICVRGELSVQSLGDLPKAATCSIKLVGNNAPMAVGYTTMSSSEMIQDAGMRGKGVIIVHYCGDHMWEFGDRSEPPLLEDPLLIQESEGVEKDKDQAVDENGNLIDVEPNIAESGANTQDASTAVTETLPDVEQLSPENGAEADEEDPRSPQEQMDELLNWCFLSAIKVSLKRSDLPILTSNFYRNYMRPCCPEDKTLDIKKSSYKKVSRFLCQMQKQEIVTLMQEKDVESITDFDRTHLDFRSLDTSSVHMAPKAGVRKEDEEDPEAAIFVPPSITEVYIVTVNTLPIFEPQGLVKGDSLTSAEVRTHLKQYAQQNKLEGPQSRGFVTLNPILHDVVTNKGEYVEALRMDELTNRCLSKMNLAHYMSLNGQPPVLKKGKLEPVNIQVQRAGNKRGRKRTWIENLEVYGIDCQEFARTVQKGIACSTAVSTMPGKNQRLHVMVQGNQSVYIGNLLVEKYRLQRKWIVDAEKLVKDKKACQLRQQLVTWDKESVDSQDEETNSLRPP